MDPEEDPILDGQGLLSSIMLKKQRLMGAALNPPVELVYCPINNLHKFTKVSFPDLIGESSFFKEFWIVRPVQDLIRGQAGQ